VNQLQLRQPRDVGALFRDALVVFGRHLGLFIALSAVVVVPVQLVVDGIGWGMLTSSYDSSPGTTETVVRTIIDFFAEFLLVTPIITAICIYALHRITDGERPSPRPVLVAGFEAFTPLFGAVLLAAVGVALGLLAFVVPGIFLLVRWYFVPQTVVIEDARGAEALTRSGQLVQGFWWRTFGLVVLANLAAAIPGVLLLAPFTAIAESTDRAVWQVAGSALATSVSTPFVALFSTLLYYDLLARRGA
jgi:hypothetical protein